jgi:hypothetical protein
VEEIPDTYTSESYLEKRKGAIEALSRGRACLRIYAVAAA